MTTLDAKLTNRPYVIVKSAMSIDGCIDDRSPQRLILSNESDFALRDDVRAESDAILVGAQTIRADNPQLLIHSEVLRQRRCCRGLDSEPIKVTMTRSGKLDPMCRFFQIGKGQKIVYCPQAAYERVQRRLSAVAHIVPYADPASSAQFMVNDLYHRGVEKLLIEGGGATNSFFLSSRGLVDEIQISIAPFFVGDIDAPRLVKVGSFPVDKTCPMRLDSVKSIGDMIVARYLLSTE